MPNPGIGNKLSFGINFSRKLKFADLLLMRYLAYMGGRVAAEGRTVEQQVLKSNPVLEAFGNTKTVKNNNSSRFGKFVEIQFDRKGKISGAAIRTYLLERSCVCQLFDPERNYHCFYKLCAAPPEEEATNAERAIKLMGASILQLCSGDAKIWAFVSKDFGRGLSRWDLRDL